jgi:hypothetical protein
MGHVWLATRFTVTDFHRLPSAGLPAHPSTSSNSAADRLITHLSRSFGCHSESRPYSRSCVGRQLGANGRRMLNDSINGR